MSEEPFLQQAKRWANTNLTTLRLSASYLAIIMVMSVGFSIVFYNTSSHQLGRQFPPDKLISTGPGIHIGEFRDFFQDRIDQGRRELMIRLVWLNILTLTGASMLSYFLARKTLEPIEAAMEAQSRFAADASHELRTPLATMQAENEVALRSPKLTLPRAKELLRSNLEETIRLRSLSDSLLKLAREDHAALTLKKVSVSDCVGDAINHVMKQAQAKNIRIDDEITGAYVQSDPASLSQVLSILLDNAIKYSGNDTVIRIHIKTNGNVVRISISDQGQGITDADMLHIFERFYRADTSRTKQHVEGHGLGLSLAAKLVEQLQGEISVESVDGKGSTFTVTLPAHV
jgi:two-component system sensor histidine kinase CiaH